MDTSAQVYFILAAQVLCRYIAFDWRATCSVPIIRKSVRMFAIRSILHIIVNRECISHVQNPAFFEAVDLPLLLRITEHSHYVTEHKVPPHVNQVISPYRSRFCQRCLLKPQ